MGLKMIIGSDGNERKIIRVAKDEVKDAVKKKEDIMFQETKILQKVNKAHREAFREKFPGQVEHCMRLTAERLQAGLDKRDSVDISNPDTWKLSPSEIAYLSEAMYYQHLIREQLKGDHKEE